MGCRRRTWRSWPGERPNHTSSFVKSTINCTSICTRRLIGTKTVINEFAAYEALSQYQANGEIGDRAAALATYALCGFANPGSIGILVRAN